MGLCYKGEDWGFLLTSLLPFQEKNSSWSPAISARLVLTCLFILTTLFYVVRKCQFLTTTTKWQRVYSLCTCTLLCGWLGGSILRYLRKKTSRKKWSSGKDRMNEGRASPGRACTGWLCSRVVEFTTIAPIRQAKLLYNKESCSVSDRREVMQEVFAPFYDSL